MWPHLDLIHPTPAKTISYRESFAQRAGILSFVSWQWSSIMTYSDEIKRRETTEMNLQSQIIKRPTDTGANDSF